MRLSRAPTAHARDLTTTQRHLGVTVLLGNTGLMNFGFSVLIPLLAVHFTGRLGFTAASIGLVLALRQFSQQGLDLVGGLIGDHFGARTSIAVGCFVRAAGFAGIGLAHTLGMLIRSRSSPASAAPSSTLPARPRWPTSSPPTAASAYTRRRQRSATPG